MAPETKDMLDAVSSIATAVATLFVAVGLFLTWLGTKQQTKAIDVQNTLNLLNEIERYNIAMRDAPDADAKEWFIRDWLNYYEFLATLHLNFRFENVTASIVKDCLIFVCVSTLHNAEVRTIYDADRKTDARTFENINAFRIKYLNDVYNAGPKSARA